MFNDKCKKCRRIGTKLFLKSEKCYSPKCPLVRKPYVPGIFGKAGRKHTKRGVSEYGAQMREKQKLKFSYGMLERQFVNYVKEAGKKAGADSSARLFAILESRLDNVVFRIGFSNSRESARQIVSHGHIMVNDRRINIPSFRMRVGDRISIRPQSVPKGVFRDIDIRLKKYNPPSWLKLDKEAKSGEVVAIPVLGDEAGMEESINTIIEFYSR